MLLVFAHLVTRSLDQFLLRLRHDHVILAERDSRLAGFTETKRHGGIAEQHRLFLSAVAIYLVDDMADFLLAQLPVDEFKRNRRTAR